MSNVKKAIVLILAILVIFVCSSTNIFASTIQPKSNNTSNNVVSNNATNETANNTANNTTNNVSNNATTNNTVNNISNNSTTLPVTNNSTHQINTTNATEDIPHTGISDTYFSFALIILLALVLGMFSLVQYNKIIKKEKDD